MKNRNRIFKKKINLKKISNIKSISCIFPVFNEEKRLLFLFKYLKENTKKNKNLEVIFVNDGSIDNSKYLIKNFMRSNRRKNKNLFKLVSYNTNKGKGYALKKGVLISNREWILTLDADLSVDFSQLDIWLKRNYLIADNKTAYFGSRLLNGSNVKALFFRKFIGHLFRMLEYLLINSRLKDTQCGFKLYHSLYAKKVFRKLQTKGFAHDIELIYLLRKKKINIMELPVKWIHKSGSKINFALDTIMMIFEIIKIRTKIKNK